LVLGAACPIVLTSRAMECSFPSAVSALDVRTIGQAAPRTNPAIFAFPY